MIFQRFGEKVPPLDPPLGYHFTKGVGQFFIFIISLDPKKAKSAKKSISIFSTDSPLNF